MSNKTKIKTLAKEYGVHRNTIRNWIHKYLEQDNKIDLYDVESVAQFRAFCETRLEELGRTYE